MISSACTVLKTARRPLQRHRWSYLRIFSTDQPSDDTASEASKTIDVPIFPWHHHPDRLPRLVEGTSQHNQSNHLLTSTPGNPGHPTINAIASAYMFLDIPWYQFLWFNHWKQDMAETMSWAFVQGMGQLLSNVYGVPVDSIMKDQHHLKLECTLPRAKETDENNETTDDATVPETDLSDLEGMIEPNYLSLFKAQQHPDKQLQRQQPLDIVLECKVESYELLTLYSLPYISRDNLANDKELKSFYRELLMKTPAQRVGDLSHLRETKMMRGIMESTLIAQTLVWCDEQFHVTDSETGEVVQGVKPDGTESRIVPHLVRMEMTVKTKMNDRGKFWNEQSNWIITDIDDMAGGNLIV